MLVEIPLEAAGFFCGGMAEMLAEMLAVTPGFDS